MKSVKNEILTKKSINDIIFCLKNNLYFNKRGTYINTYGQSKQTGAIISDGTIFQHMKECYPADDIKI